MIRNLLATIKEKISPHLIPFSVFTFFSLIVSLTMSYAEYHIGEKRHLDQLIIYGGIWFASLYSLCILVYSFVRIIKGLRNK
jgi:hypothetical protein